MNALRAWPSWILVGGLASLFACGDDGGPGGGGAGGAGSGGGPDGDGGSGSSSASTGSDGGAGGSGQGGAGQGGGGGGAAWVVPTCASIAGTAAVTYTTDEGETLAPTTGMLSGVTYTFGLVASGVENVLVASSGGRLLRSTDAGCTWTDEGELPITTMALVAGPGDTVYGWFDNQDVLVRIEGTTAVTLDPPGNGLHGVGVDSMDPLHVRVADDVGQMHESFDGGETFAPIGVPIGGNDVLLYTVAFDPTDLDHALAGVATDGAFVTTDGGATWDAAQGLGEAGNANAFAIVVSPADPQVVWLQGFDLGTAIGDEVRRIWRSTDGGASFVPVVAQTPEITLTNGVVMAAHPTDAGVLYFVFGTYFQDYGTDLYRYDHATAQVTWTHNAYDDVSSIAFHPADPDVMYLGLTSEQIGVAP